MRVGLDPQLWRWVQGDATALSGWLWRITSSRCGFGSPGAVTREAARLVDSASAGAGRCFKNPVEVQRYLFRVGRGDVSRMVERMMWVHHGCAHPVVSLLTALSGLTCWDRLRRGLGRSGVRSPAI